MTERNGCEAEMTEQIKAWHLSLCIVVPLRTGFCVVAETLIAKALEKEMSQMDVR